MVNKVKIRSPVHLRWVKSHPCSIKRDGESCCLKPVDPHHLMQMGGRGGALKEDDMWTVPLCRFHHAEVTGYGKEYLFWLKYGYEYNDVIEIARMMSLYSPDKKIVQAMEIWRSKNAY